MFRVRKIIEYFGLKRFQTQWRILMWKAVLMRLHSPIISILEVVIAVIFSLQIQLMFEPHALQTQDLDLYNRDDILEKLPRDVLCSYAPRNAFVDELMSRASRMLHTNIQAADSEIDLVHSRFMRNDTSKVLWAIFNVDKSVSGIPTILDYKIRSSEIGENPMIMMHEEEPAPKDPYVLSGFMALQLAIEKTFVELWTNPTLPKVDDNLTIGRFPFYKVDFLILPFVIRPNTSVIYYMTVIAFLLLPTATLRMALHDKETGFTGLMKLTNMSYAMLYIGWLNYLLITVLPVTIACTILLYPVFSENTNALIIAIFVMMYNILSTLFMFAVGAFFNHSTKALLTSILSWLFLTHITIVLDQVLVKESVIWRIGSLILPHSGLLYGLVTFTSHTNLVFMPIGDYETDDLRNILREMKPRYHVDNTSYLWPQWLKDLITLRDIYDIMYAKDKISISVILFAWSLHIVFWYLIVIYLSNIHPGKFGSAKPWYYLCKKFTYDNEEQTTFRGSTNWSAVEHTPSYIKPSIRLRCVTKKFSEMEERITAVDNVTIDFYRQEFSVILGHNGAGKSCLLKMIIGMYKPTHGRIYLEEKGLNEVESSMGPIGYCPQENILVNYLTMMQHLCMLAMMKGMSYKDAYKESLKLLKELNLESVQNLKVKACSFYTQRRICLAMALIANTKILILDEPTYGFDLEHSRQMWDLLSNIKRKKTILMATNSMETADLLADRIAIIANGKIECYGSKMYLNRRYGIGYVLSLLVQEDTNADTNADTNVERLHTEIQGFSAEPVTLRSTMGLVIRFDVPRSSRFNKLLHHLESKKEELGIVSVTLDAASIEGQFLKIGLSSQFKERGVHLSSSKCELIMQQRRRHLLQTCKSWERLTGNALRRQQILAMFYKKLLHLTSSWRMYVFSTTLAVVTLVLTTMIGELTSFTYFDKTENVMNLTKYSNNLRVLYWAAAENTAQDFLVTLYTTGQSYSEHHNYHISKNITATDHMVHPDLHSIEFRDRYVMSIDVHANGHIQLMYSSTAVHSGPVALNLLYNALLRYHSGSDDCWIKLTSRPVISPGQIFEEKNRRKWNSYFTPSMRKDDNAQLEVIENIRIGGNMDNDKTKLFRSRVALAVQNLKKEYAGKMIVAEIDFNIYAQECFGLLGLNGAGKSTIYKMLTGQTQISTGRAIIYGHEFDKDQEIFIGMIGYCPQMNGLSDFMTGRQYLQLYAALRGIPYRYINDEVNKWLDILDMLDFENIKIDRCPSGVQRKISILQSLIGDLPMVFMDEPSAGIDVMSRHALCEILQQIRKMGRTILITTHSMREAEAMCSRVGILVNGQLTAVGSCEQLKAKYGRNFIMIIKIIPGFQLENLEKIKKLIDENFPAIKFADSHLGVLKYELESNMSYSYVFDKLEKLRQRYMWVTDFSITQPSMDEVFLSLMKKQEISTGELTFLVRLSLLIARIIRGIHSR